MIENDNDALLVAAKFRLIGVDDLLFVLSVENWWMNMPLATSEDRQRWK